MIKYTSTFLNKINNIAWYNYKYIEFFKFKFTVRIITRTTVHQEFSSTFHNIIYFQVNFTFLSNLPTVLRDLYTLYLAIIC